MLLKLSLYEVLFLLPFCFWLHLWPVWPSHKGLGDQSLMKPYPVNRGPFDFLSISTILMQYSISNA